jgi:hypothetical protein
MKLWHVLVVLVALVMGGRLTAELPAVIATILTAALIAATVLVVAKSTVRGIMLASLVFVAIGAAGGTVSALDRAVQASKAEKLRAAEAKRAEEAKHAELARIPERVQRVRYAMAEKNWLTAASAYRDIANADPQVAESLAAEWSVIEPEIAAIEKAQAEEERARTELARLGRVDGVVAEAERVGADSTLCDTPTPVADAWRGLGIVGKDDKIYRRAQKAAVRLERCRKLMLRHLEDGARAIRVAQRRSAKETLDKMFLKSSLDVRVTVSGAQADSITMTHVFFDSRVWMHKFEEAGLFQTLQTLGFKKVYFRTGYDGGFNYTLSPESEIGMAPPPSMVEMGLGAPLVL